MKHTIFIKYLFIISIVIITSCDKLLHEDYNINESVNIRIINTDEDLATAINGCYHKLAVIIGSNNLYIQTIYGDDIDLRYYGNRSKIDDWQGNFLYYTPCELGFSNLEYNTRLNEKTRMYWEDLYETIINTNNIIIQFENEANSFMERSVLGEAYLIRTYCYFRLVRIFNEVPIITDLDIDYHVQKSTTKDIYKFIENDLIRAVKLLPSNNEQARIPYKSVHRGTAKAILAEVYLTMGGFPLFDNRGYANAAKYAKEVIDSANYFGFILEEDMETLWEDAEIYFEAVLASHYTCWFPAEYPNEFNNYDQGDNFTSGLVLGSYNSSFFGPDPEINFYNNFPKDYRRDITYLNYPYIFETHSSVIDPSFQGGYVYFDTIDFCTEMKFRKHYNINTDNFGFLDSYNGFIIYIYRYAHTLLTYAEAKAHIGELDESAYEAINMVRRRAKKIDIYTESEYDLKTGLSQELFLDSVVWERAWEFCAEPEGRWFDLLRLEMVEEIPELRHPDQPGPPQEEDINANIYFAPVPTEEIKLNPYLNDPAE